jgi:hypothetical protein
MKYRIALLTTVLFLGVTQSYAQEANNIAPPPPPEIAEEEEEAPAAPAAKKVKKLDHCSPVTTKTCDGLEEVADLGEEAWKIGAMGAAMCSKSAAIEATRKSRKDRIEYEQLLAEIAEDNETEYSPWVPPETNSEFATRTTAECSSNHEYWCGEMQLASAGISDPALQAEALALVEEACTPPQ